uniref:YraN family protein n=1 Tax=Crenothrix polyspora TaxID=360316 RepID=UPI000B360F39|nr:YraN family protein [Crenothrix polyspora]
MATKTSARPQHLLRGEAAEEQAHQFLINNGLQPVCRNFRCKYGELDLIMTDGNTLVIIEVRFRKTDSYGSALESITHSKQGRIIAATQYYLSGQKSEPAIRFDVIALSGNGSLQWVKNAF